MKRLTKAQIIQMHTALIAESGGSDGLRDEGLLDSAINATFQTFDKQYVYPTIQSKAARLAYFLVKNHAFVDGNKRIGILAMLVFLQINGIALHCSDEELIRLGYGLADSSMDDQMLLQWILAHSR